MANFNPLAIVYNFEIGDTVLARTPPNQHPITGVYRTLTAAASVIVCLFEALTTCLLGRDRWVSDQCGVAQLYRVVPMALDGTLNLLQARLITRTLKSGAIHLSTLLAVRFG